MYSEHSLLSIYVYTVSHAIMQVNFFDITFTVVINNSFIFVHVLATPICAYCTILKGICPKVKNCDTSPNISELDRPTKEI